MAVNNVLHSRLISQTESHACQIMASFICLATEHPPAVNTMWVVWGNHYPVPGNSICSTLSLQNNVLNALCSSRLRNVVLLILLHFDESSRCLRNIPSSQFVMFSKAAFKIVGVDGSEVHNITCSILHVFNDQRLNWILGEWWWR